MAVAGKRYKVIGDTAEFFEPGEIVVALQSDDCPFCIREKDYTPDNPTFAAYDTDLYNALDDDELEEIE